MWLIKSLTRYPDFDFYKNNNLFSIIIKYVKYLIVLNDIKNQFKKFLMTFKKILFPLYIATTILFLQSCKLINPDEQIPSYISIKNISFKTNINYDTDSYDITDAWVYVDDNLIGAFELPAKFPVLYSGKHKVSVRAGILLNGISATRSVYPFYTVYDTIYSLVAGKVVSLNPKVTYNPTVRFIWTENFENPNISFKKTIKSDTIFKLIPNSAPDYFQYGGKYAGGISLTTAKPYFECITDTSYILPYGDRPTFLELNYKNTNSFSVSVQVVTRTGIAIEEYLTINPSTEWKKIYVNLTPITNLYTSVTGYKIFFNHMIDPGLTEGLILIDNIKLVAGS